MQPLAKKVHRLSIFLIRPWIWWLRTTICKDLLSADPDSACEFGRGKQFVSPRHPQSGLVKNAPLLARVLSFFTRKSVNKCSRVFEGEALHNAFFHTSPGPSLNSVVPRRTTAANRAGVCGPSKSASLRPLLRMCVSERLSRCGSVPQIQPYVPAISEKLPFSPAGGGETRHVVSEYHLYDRRGTPINMGDISKLAEGRRLGGREGSERIVSAVTYGHVSSFPHVQICKVLLVPFPEWSCCVSKKDVLKYFNIIKRSDLQGWLLFANSITQLLQTWIFKAVWLQHPLLLGLEVTGGKWVLLECLLLLIPWCIPGPDSMQRAVGAILFRVCCARHPLGVEIISLHKLFCKKFEYVKHSLI